MTALTINFTPDEMDAIRRAATAAGTSVDAFVRGVTLGSTDLHRVRVRHAAALVAEHSAELNRRLA